MVWTYRDLICSGASPIRKTFGLKVQFQECSLCRVVAVLKIGQIVFSIALLLNEASDKKTKCKIGNGVTVSKTFVEIARKSREISCAFLAGRKVFPPNFINCFSYLRFQISNQISPKNFTTHFCRHGRPIYFWTCCMAAEPS